MPPTQTTDLVSRIKDMKAKGLNNNQIIQTLQRDGMSMTNIFDAMNQTTLPQQPLKTPYPQPRPMQPLPPTPFPRAQPMPQQGPDVEKLVEAIIEEKWTDIEDDIHKIIEWKDVIEERIAKIEQSVADMKGEFDKLHNSIVGKVSEYDKHIMNVGAEVQAMEKVFSKVLPAFVENVAALDEITARVKSSKPVSKKK